MIPLAWTNTTPCPTTPRLTALYKSTTNLPADEVQPRPDYRPRWRAWARVRGWTSSPPVISTRCYCICRASGSTTMPCQIHRTCTQLTDPLVSIIKSIFMLTCRAGKHLHSLGIRRTHQSFSPSLMSKGLHIVLNYTASGPCVHRDSSKFVQDQFWSPFIQSLWIKPLLVPRSCSLVLKWILIA